LLIFSVSAEATMAPARPIMLSTPMVLGCRWISRTRKTIITAPAAAWNNIVVAVFSAIGRSSGCRNT
jgi:hypothetical protein